MSERSILKIILKKGKKENNAVDNTRAVRSITFMQQQFSCTHLIFEDALLPAELYNPLLVLAPLPTLLLIREEPVLRSE